MSSASVDQDLEKYLLRNELFELLGVNDGDRIYADCLLVADYIAKRESALKQELKQSLEAQLLRHAYLGEMGAMIVNEKRVKMVIADVFQDKGDNRGTK